MTSTTISQTAAQQVVKKHPIRGAIWGLLLGFSLAIYAVLFAVIPFTDWLPLGLVVVAGVAIGVAWAYLAPAKTAKGESAPVSTEAEEPADAVPVSEEPIADDMAPATDEGPPSEDTPADQA